jgi:predicted permease
VSAAQALPVGGGLWDRGVQVEGYAARPDEPNVAFNVIAPDYFSTLRTPIVSGREFTDRDTATALRVAVVNQSFARYFFGNGSPLGRRVTSVGVTYEIVGVVGDTKYQGLREPMLRTMYIPWTQREGDAPSAYRYLVRTADNPATAAQGLDRVVRTVDPGLRLRSATSYEGLIDQSISIERIMAMLGALFGGLALLIAALGMFGALAFQVTRRTNELGVRMVLGASRWSMIRLVLRDVAMMLVPGIAVGAGAALMLTGMSRALLFDLTPTDPAVFALSAFVLASASIVAGWLPARRAAFVDPMVAIRHE